VTHIQIDAVREPRAILTTAAAATGGKVLLLQLLFVAAAVPEVGVLKLYNISFMGLNLQRKQQ
jgi:hypothetical protein